MNNVFCNWNCMLDSQHVLTEHFLKHNFLSFRKSSRFVHFYSKGLIVAKKGFNSNLI